jgi:shikimate kinase
MTNTFLDKFIKRCPKITFIGMSGLGKSYWSRKMVESGFKRLCCDDVIADRLGKLSNRGRIADLGEWMGFPYEPEYRRKEKIYLSLEIKVLNEFIDRLANADPEENIVIDTTGSAPYAGDDVMNRLGKHSCVIYLAASKQYFSEMLERYINCPRPVLWGDKYQQEPFESKKQALARSYEELLIFRDQLYKKHAHYIIPYEMHRI